MKKHLVVGRGLIGRMLAEDKRFDLVSRKAFYGWLPDATRCNGYICTAAASSERSCRAVSWNEVLRGNVDLPLQMAARAKRENVSCVLFSTSGVYLNPGISKETDDVEPHNRYTASKLMMECGARRYHRCYVFRIPFVCLWGDGTMDMRNRVRGWTQCEDVETSIVYREELMLAVTNALEGNVPGGIYNVMSENIRLPEFIKSKFDWQGEVVAQGGLGLTPSTCLDIRKARARGLL